ncbi:MULTISPECIES: cellulose biosynthesis cyclic di-GMP-binding regulatory protein BcsB [unclassified Achromobacter]|uniref:cellulose biosynthesis cyclic di-GMP-binding regulatory protein BcsB n=1 Tax=unclassified Achromobacter TaxID=2626865 RepID=UPI001E38A64A|nr:MULTISPECIES: cellulose biosynthesis cyclic di-GMP-binding regulatory protein BcsB [unclassified Achromobacter]
MTPRLEARPLLLRRSRVLPALVSALLSLAASRAMAAPTDTAPAGPAATPQTAPQAAPQAAAPTAPLPPGAYTYSIPLSRLSGQTALPLRGVDGTNGLGFAQRIDQTIIGANVHLDYTYSPSLLPDLSHLKIILNGEVAQSITLPKEAAAEPVERTVALPVPAMSEFNRLDIQLVGHYTLGCEDPLHSSLWADVAGRSTLDLTVLPVDLPNDLALLPAPFFDSHDIRQLDLPIVLGRTPDSARLESAGIVSSWFGAQAGYRGARFTATVQDLPAKGNAVVLLQQGDNVPGLQAAAVQGATLAMVANPNDPHGKLLLVMGRDAKELRQAAIALALGNQTLSGPTVRINELATLTPRKPFDAPNWLRSDRPVQFGELATARTLNVYGHRPAPINVPLRMPPGLFGWHSDGVPVQLKYRYSPRPDATQSVMEMVAGNQLVRSFRLNDGTPGVFSKMSGMPVSEDEARVMVPTYLLPPLTALQFRYVYEYAKLGECQNSIVDNIQSAIDPGSSIDISSLPKYAAMPDLSLFADAGFPFTRMADLSETAVVLPDGAGLSDYGAYLTLLGAMGQATGYPATGVTVAQAAQVESLKDKDFLVLASGNNQPLVKQWSAYLPNGFDGNQHRFSVSDWFSGIANWFGPDPRDRKRTADLKLTYVGSGANAMLAGLQSPLQSGRSVVLLSGSNSAGLDAAVDAVLANRDTMNKVEDLQYKIGGSLTVVSGKQALTVLDDQSYYVGSLPIWLGMQWFFSNHPLTLVAALVISALVIAVLLYLSLRARAHRRLGS